MVYVGQTRSRTLVPRLEALGFGEMTCRGEWPPRRRPFALDNGAFKDWRARREFDADAYERDLDKMARDGDRPDFVVVPDVVADGERSLRFSLEWAPRLRGVAPLYLVVQDGMTGQQVADVIEPFAGIFVGGSLGWKLRTAHEWASLARSLGRRCHVGRVGTFNRVRWARRFRADSIDSCLPLWSEENLQRFLAALGPVGQGELFGGAA